MNHRISYGAFSHPPKISRRPKLMSEQIITPWHHSIDLAWPCWEDYADALNKLLARQDHGSELPTFSDLQSLMSPAVSNLQGKAIQFVAPSTLPATPYEEEIFNTGRVSTRTNSWHDLFNALVWWRFPALKAAMNAMHFNEMQNQTDSGRGKLRDALTLLDECGVIVASSNAQVLEKLAERNWQGAFRDSVQRWHDDIQVFVCGHALLEKFLNPYKSITAHAVLVQLDSGALALDRTTLLANLDRTLATQMLRRDLVNTTADLSPLPLAGIPGWWRSGQQDDDFYADGRVFRIPVAPIKLAPIVEINLR